MTTINEKKGKYTEYNNISKSFIKNLITIEDKHFFKHKGINILRIFTSFIHNIKNPESIQGASTITMQLARLIHLNQEQTLKRKILELFIALKLERTYSKEEILEFYLNKIYFAHGVYGLENASNYYFGKEIKDLTLKEQVILIGIINAPNLYSPYIDKVASDSKSKSILRQLKDSNVISIKDYYSALFENPILINHDDDISYIYPYYVDSIKEEMYKKGIKNNDILNRGLIVKSYLNTNVQNYIDKLISSINFGTSDVSICVMEVNSGKVVALCGGKDYATSTFNRTLHAKKQIGSTIKPLLYYLALKKGLTPLSEFNSEKTTFKLSDDKYYEVSNASEVYANRKITMLEALAMSDNIYAMKTMLLIGKNNLINLIKSFGFNVDVDNETLALGSNTLTPLELTSIYNAIASDGIYYTPKFIDEITYSDGFSIYKSGNSNKRIFTKNTNTIIQYMLRAPFDKSLKSYASPSLMNYYISPSYAGKTGTTDSSSYVIGFSPSYTIGVYIGSDDNSSITNGYLSREIFYNVAKYLENKNEGYFKIPSSLKSFKLYNKSNNLLSFEYVY